MDRFFINEDLLISHNKIGIFPFPGEGEEDFLKRVRCFSSKKRAFMQKPFSFKKLEDLFDISPYWATFQYTNAGLRFWEAASLEVQGNDYTLKLKKTFERKSRYLGLYSRDEIIFHECCHLGRLGFDEPKYEEIFAYQTSKGLRRLLGPLFGSPSESLILMFLLVGSIFSHFIYSLPIWGWILWKGAPLLYLGCLGKRLFWRYNRFRRCKRKLAKVVKNASKVLPVMFRLSDEEIDLFAKSSVEKIKKYFHDQDEIRWKIIKKAYLPL